MTRITLRIAARHELDRLSLGANDAQAVRLLAGRLPPGEYLEEDVVRDHDQEGADRADRDAEAVAGGPREYRDGHDENDLDRQVDERSRAPRADAREGQLELDPLGRRDREAILVVHSPVNVRAFTAERKPGWTELERARGPCRPARQSASAPRSCAAWEPSTAPVPPTSRWPAGRSRRSASSPSSRPRRARATARLRVPDAPALVRRVRHHRLLAAGRRAAGFCSLLSAALLFGSGASRGRRGRSRDPGAAAGLVPCAVPKRDRARAARHRPRALRRTRRRRCRAEIFTNNIRVTLLAFAGGITVGLGTRPRCCSQRRAARRRRRARDRRGQRRAVLRARHGARRARAVVHRRRGRGRACASAGRSSSPDAARAVDVAAARGPHGGRARRSARRRGSSLAGLVEGFVTPAGLGLATRS